MKIIKRWIRSYFGFSRTETNGFMVLLPLMAIAIFSAPVYRWLVTDRDIPAGEYAYLDSLTMRWETPAQAPAAVAVVKRFPFDPNTVTHPELLNLGFDERLATRLVNYRSKGGYFRVKSDLLKLYGMEPDFFAAISPFVQLPEEVEIPEKRTAIARNSPDSGSKSTNLSIEAGFDLNTADSLRFQAIRGIGKVLSGRILRFRESLGGFIDPNQLYEVYGLDSAVVADLLRYGFVEEDFVPNRININEASENDLERHPYLSRKQATAIVTYRFQHGPFSSVMELKRVLPAPDTALKRILPYLTTGE